MSSPSRLEVECPSCKKKQDILIWQALDVTGNPALKEQLFTGRINYFTCDSCDFEGFITAPLTYRDREKRVSARYVPVELFEQEDYLRQSFSPDGRARPEDPAPETEPHIVFSMTELIRYVLFRERLEQVHAETNQGA